MADNTIDIIFGAKGDKDVIKAINDLDKSTKKLINTQASLTKTGKSQVKQHSQSQKSMNALNTKLKALGLSFKKAEINQNSLKKAYRGNRTELVKVKLATQKYIREQEKGDVATRILGGSFAVLRSKMLLFNFAMGLGVKQLIDLTRETARIESMSRAFNTLAGSGNDSIIALEKLKQATDNTMSSFDLFQQANNAMILGVTKNSDEMAEMFDIAQRLGRALGRDTASSVESLITGIGRQSRLMLDNIGIIVKSEEAYKKYAKELGKTADKLTDSEKKQAFLEATMESAREKVETLGKETLSTEDIFGQLGVAVNEAGISIGTTLTPAMIAVSEALRAGAITAKGFFDIVNDILGLGTEVKEEFPLNTQIDLLIGKLKELAGAGFIKNNPFALYGEEIANVPIEEATVNITALGTQFGITSSQVEEMQNKISALKEEIAGNFRPELETLSDHMVDFLPEEDLSEGLNFDILEGFIKEQDKLFEDQNRKKIELDKVKEEEFKKSESARKRILAGTVQFELEQLRILEKEYLANFEHTLETERFFNEQRKTIINEHSEEQKKLMEEQQELLDQQHRDKLDKLKEERDARFEMADFVKNQAQNLLGFHADNVQRRKDNAIKALKDSDEYERASSEKRKTMEKEVNKSFADEEKRLFEMKKLSSLADIAMNTAKGISKFAGNPIMMGVVTAIGAMQAGVVMSQEAPKYEQGGLVGGNRHSQGGTLIEAERGEFVMSRNAVESIGTETLNQINQGGGAGVTVNISAPLVDDSIIDTIIPAINRAVQGDRATLISTGNVRA